MQHLPPFSRIEKSNSYRMLHEGGDTSRLSGGDKCSNFFELTVRKRDGDLHGHYSYRSAIQGSVRAARRAGSSVAVRATASSTRGTPTKVTASVALIP